VRVRWAVLARFAEDHDGLVSISSAGLDTFWVPEVPHPIQFFMVAHFRFAETEAGEEKTIVFEVRGPGLEVVGQEVAIPARLELGPAHLEGWEAGINLIVPTTIGIEDAGAHSIRLLIDGHQVWDQPFMVRTLE
jgi:uncharacterized protein DUF6941